MNRDEAIRRAEKITRELMPTLKKALGGQPPRFKGWYSPTQRRSGSPAITSRTIRSRPRNCARRCSRSMSTRSAIFSAEVYTE